MRVRFTTGRTLLGLGCACLSLAVSRPALATPTASNRPASIRELSRAWTRSIPPLPARGAAGTGSSTGRADALAALMGGGNDDGRCATALLVAMYQNGSRLNPPTRRWLEQLTRPPSSAAGSTGHLQGATLQSSGGEFLIHYSTDPLSLDRVEATDGDLNGVPDGVDRLAVELTDELADFVHVLGWAPAPAPGATRGSGGAIDVYLSGGLGSDAGLMGFVMPRGAGWAPGTPAATGGAPGEGEPAEGADAAIYLDSRLAAAKASSRDAVAHMVAHVILMRESVRESPWWHEATATWLENRLRHDAPVVASSFGTPAGAARARGLSDDALQLSAEAFLWPHYLTQSAGADTPLLRRLWEEMAAVPGNNTLEAMDRVLRRTAGSSLAEEIRVFNIWNIFLGQADDGHHYPFASLMPTPQGDATYETFPTRGTSLSGPVPPLGSALVRMLGDGSQGGLRVRFFGAEPGEWDVSLLVYSAGRSGEVRHVAMEIDGSGRGFVPVPWKGLAAIDLMIQNLAAPAMAPADYYFTIDYDPAVPYDLMALNAEDAGGRAMLTWSTESEERLAGWNVWRGPGPLGPFSRINRYLVPGAGQPDTPMSYFFVDSSVEPGRKYYYYLEGVTLEGFTETSHPTGVRLARPPAKSPASR